MWLSLYIPSLECLLAWGGGGRLTKRLLSDSRVELGGRYLGSVIFSRSSSQPASALLLGIEPGNISFYDFRKLFGICL
jgi:hypothetical protein